MDFYKISINDILIIHDDLDLAVGTYKIKKKGSSGGGGGGGGSSSPPKYNEEKHKNTSDEKERYHVIKNQLEDLSSQYENISKAKDKAFGATRLANLNKEISAQKKLT